MLFERRNPTSIDALVHVEPVGALLSSLRPAHADVDVQQAVLIDVHQGDARRPRALGGHVGSHRYVFKPEIPLIEVQPVSHPIAREVQIRPPIAVDIADADAAAVVDIKEIERIHEGVVLRDDVDKIDPRSPGIEALEQPVRFIRAPAGHRPENDSEKQRERDRAVVNHLDGAWRRKT